MEKYDFLTSLSSGAVAGFSVDMALFPVDTIKTRLQSKQGFFKSGGFHKLYSGFGSVALGSAPSAAFFFLAYDFTRKLLHKNETHYSTTRAIICNMAAASVGEVVACVVRVPVEVIKQRAQVNSDIRSIKILSNCMREDGFSGLYRGYRSTVFREIPFSVIQFPLWELLKSTLAKKQGCEVTSLQSAWCGFVCGGVAAAITTPLDVSKTRIMLARRHELDARGKIIPVLCSIWKHEGINSLFAGILPRVVLISCGGFIFLGMFDLSKNIIHRCTSKT